MRFLAPLALLLASTPAYAGFGTTIGMGSGLGSFFTGGGIFGNQFVFFSSSGFAPSLDYRANNLVLQFHVLETLAALTSEELFLGANVYVQVHEAEVGGPWRGVVQPGGGLDIWSDDFGFALTGEGRFGIETTGGATFGVYVVPAVGLALVNDDAELISTGTLQVGITF